MAWALMKPRTITVDGDRIVYRTAGKGPVLLLVHGMAGSSLTWRHVMPALARRFTVLAPDLLGQGQSDKPRGDYSLGTHANTLRDLLDPLSLPVRSTPRRAGPQRAADSRPSA
jgi:pimeloyl-ACP methyl ester carboxylesterase